MVLLQCCGSGIWLAMHYFFWQRAALQPHEALVATSAFCFRRFSAFASETEVLADQV